MGIIFIVAETKHPGQARIARIVEIPINKVLLKYPSHRLLPCHLSFILAVALDRMDKALDYSAVPVPIVKNGGNMPGAGGNIDLPGAFGGMIKIQ